MSNVNLKKAINALRSSNTVATHEQRMRDYNTKRSGDHDNPFKTWDKSGMWKISKRQARDFDLEGSDMAAKADNKRIYKTIRKQEDKRANKISHLRKALDESRAKGNEYNEERDFRSRAKHLGVAANKSTNTRKEGEAFRALMRQNAKTNSLKKQLDHREARAEGRPTDHGVDHSVNKNILEKFAEKKGAYSLAQKAKKDRK